MTTFTAFADHNVIAHGSLEHVALAAVPHREHAVLVLRDSTGHVVDLDLRGEADDVLRALADHPMAPSPPPPPAPRGRGRPKLGVTAKEVTLLPRHWEWLAGQKRSASATLRTLVEQEMKRTRPQRARAEAADRAYRAMQALGEAQPDFEEASRALFAHDLEALEQQLQRWPTDLREYVLRLATPAA